MTPTGASIALFGGAGHNTTSGQRGGCRRARRARAGFEIDHSEPQTRVWRSRGRPGPKAPDTQAPHHNLEPRPTSARPPGTNTTGSQRGGRPGPEGTGGLRDRPLRAADSRVAVSRAAGPEGTRHSGTTPNNNIKLRPTSARPPGTNTRSSQRGGRPGPEAPDTQALLTDTSMSREKRGPVRTGNRVPSGGPRPGWRPPRLCPGRPGVPQPARSRGGRR